MTSRQSIPECWLILGGDIDRETWKRLALQPRGSGILLIAKLPASDLRRLEFVARTRHLLIVREAPGLASRAHNMHELRLALLRRTALIFLSPIHKTNSHPEWQALPRMRAAAFARLSGRRLIALGGMDKRRFRLAAPLGFIGWAGITAWHKGAQKRLPNDH